MIQNEEEYEQLLINIEMKKITLFLKRIFDLLVSIVMFILLLPVYIIISLLILKDSGKPILFKQERMGRNGERFNIYKFRTMYVDSETLDGITKKNDARITDIGRVLRKYRIDELPQLINIIKGDMSFVGPRPDMPIYYYTNDYAYKSVLLVRPGVTGRATLKYKDEDKILNESENPEYDYRNIIFPEKVKMNLEYIENINLLNDIKLLFETVVEVFIK